MASNRARSNNTLGTRLNSLSSKIEDQEAKSRGNSDGSLSDRLDAIEAKQEQLESPNWRVEQESQFLIDAFPILSGGSSGQPIGPATETKQGLVELATQFEAELSTGTSIPNVAMTPQRTKNMLDMYAPAASRAQTAVNALDWNRVANTGFYKGYYYAGSPSTTTKNGPPVSVDTSFLGMVMDSSTINVSSGEEAFVTQVLWEFFPVDNGSSISGATGRIWTRVGRPGKPTATTPTDAVLLTKWSTWTSDDGTMTNVGKVRLATVAEATTGTSQTTAVTPAGLKAVGDTKAPLSHVHSGADITSGTVAPARLPAATDTAIGAVELATPAEATTGTDTTRAVTPQGLKTVADTKAALSHTHTASQITDFNTAADARVNALVPAATTGTAGKAALATNAEVQAGTVTDKIVTPSGLNSRVASDTATGLVELATPAEATTGTDTARAVTPQGLKTVADTKAPLSHTHTTSQITDYATATDARINSLVPQASTTVVGKLSLATDAETQAGTVSTKAVTPSSLSARTSTETRTGIARLADQWEAILHHGDFNGTVMSPQRVMDAINSFAPAVARGRGGVNVTNWNLAIATGFYQGYYSAFGDGALNCPPITGTNFRYLSGIVIDASFYGIDVGSGGPRIQIVWEYDSNGTGVANGGQETGTVLREWRRVAAGWVGTETSTINWGPWVSSDGTTTNVGGVRLATTSEASTGTSQAIAVTPAGLKAVADTKAALVHTHVMSDITDLPARASAATPNALIQRDANGRAQVATPSVAADIATKGYVDSLTTVNAGRGTTAERDAYFGTPSVTADQVALANRKVTWFNTDLGWQESYYVVQGTSGLTARGLITGAPAGWYPTAEGPRIRLFSNGGQAHSNGTEFSNWKAFSPAGTATENDSYKFGNVLTRTGTNSWVETSLWGKYDIFGAMYFPNGTGTGVFELTNYRPSTSSYPFQIQKAVPLLGSYGQIVDWSIPEQYIRPADRIHFRTAAASWTVGGGFSHLTLRYVGPPLDTAS